LRSSQRFKLYNPAGFKESLLQWATQYEEVVFLDSNDQEDQYGSFECLLAVEAHTKINVAQGEAFATLKAYKKQVKDWIFGYLGYDLKNELEALDSKNPDGLEFETLFFFQPKRIILVKENHVEFLYLSEYAPLISEDFDSIATSVYKESNLSYTNEHPKIKLRLNKDEYLGKVKNVLEYIQRGTIYEVNICQEFYVNDCTINPVRTFQNLNRISTPPFAAFLKWNNNFALCASPERYLKRIGEKVISQPIKGTAARSTDFEKDEALRNALANDPKEQAENVMIVDLVRNDLSKKSKRGTVMVEELFGIRSFKQVHQMISTITGDFDTAIDAVEIIKDTFPMGSMTGAPKIAAMKIIEEIEVSKRGLYSGAVGYFTPTDDFDFNVVIRSILFNATNNYVSYTVGSAITANSVPVKEYEECLLKAKAMRSVLESQ